MILRVLRYAYGGAKVMALKGRLLTPEDYHFLLRARNLEDFWGYLLTTAYGPVLDGWDWHTPEAEREFSRRLYGDLAQAFQKVSRGLKRREQSFIAVLAQRLAAENLKVILRTLHRGLAPARALDLLLPLGKLSPLNFTELLNQKTIAGLVDFLAPTPWGPPLARGMPRYLREGNLFPLEMSLDLWVFDVLEQGLKHLSLGDRRIAGHLFHTLADITNLIWTSRFREIYGFPGEEIYQYLLEVGSFRNPRRRHDLAFAPDLADMTARLPRHPYGALLQGVAGLAEMESRLWQFWVKTLERVASRPPFQIGLPMAYLYFKELEIQNIITLFTGILLGVPGDLTAPLLRGRAAGGAHV